MTSFQEMPQPRTFAPSKEDVLQNLQYFFGAPVSPEKLKDYSEHHAMTCAPPWIKASLELSQIHHAPSSHHISCHAQTIFLTRTPARTCEFRPSLC